ncbi:MAG TPA: phosphoribosylamine--glycine ligase [Acetobacteraceae bacterium]|nr:phosphoribosylamine--glycine ligase [Acetobacteraceae bacterium]
MTQHASLAVFAGLMLLGACASRSPETTAQAACRREAYADPQVKTLIANSNPAVTNNIFDKSLTTPQEDAQAAVRQATLDCMRRRGLATPGGVEPVKRYPFSPLAF